MFKRHFLLSVCHTTRSPRTKEENLEDYFFVTQEEFEQGVVMVRFHSALDCLARCVSYSNSLPFLTFSFFFYYPISFSFHFFFSFYCHSFAGQVPSDLPASGKLVRSHERGRGKCGPRGTCCSVSYGLTGLKFCSSYIGVNQR